MVVNILVQFAAKHAGEYHSFMLTHPARRHGAAGDRESFRGPLIVSRELSRKSRSG